MPAHHHPLAVPPIAPAGAIAEEDRGSAIRAAEADKAAAIEQAQAEAAAAIRDADAHTARQA